MLVRFGGRTLSDESEIGCGVRDTQRDEEASYGVRRRVSLVLDVLHCEVKGVHRAVQRYMLAAVFQYPHLQ